jgi:hypothetical protein
VGNKITVIFVEPLTEGRIAIGNGIMVVTFVDELRRLTAH